MQRPPLNISREGLGRLIEDLSFGGAPINDVEDMRSNFPDRYSISWELRKRKRDSDYSAIRAKRSISRFGLKPDFQAEALPF